MSSDLELIFLHIPKTAGSTLTHVLSRVYGRESVLVVGVDTPRVSGPIPENLLLPETRVLTGHITYSQVSHLHQPSKTALVTLLREPLSRTLSAYYHLKRKESGRTWYGSIAGRLPLRLHLRQARYRNVMARYIEGIDWAAMDFVGLFETFEADVTRLATQLGWDDSRFPRGFGQKAIINENLAYPAELRHVSTRQMNAIRRANWRDIALYDSVRAARGLPENRA